MDKLRKKRLLNNGIAIVLVIVLYVLLEILIRTELLNPIGFTSDFFKKMFINIILAVSLNLVTGFLGQLSLGHAGFMSVGAYTAALITIHADLPIYIEFPLALLAGGLMAVVFGLIVGIPCLRLKGDYLAILTLGFGEIIKVIMTNLKGLTNGASGLNAIPSYSKFGYVYFISILTVYIIYKFIKSRHGRAVISIRENEIAAESCGVNLTYYKLFAFLIASFFAGIAGGLYAHNIGYIAPKTFDYNYSIEILIMVVLGGMGSITGSVVAACALTIIPQLLKYMNLGQCQMLLYSIILIAIMLFRPYGLMGKYEFSLSKLLNKGKRASQGGTENE